MGDTVLITGANRGIGLATLKELAARGWAIVAHASRESSWAKVRQPLLSELAARGIGSPIDFVHGDFTDPAQITSLIKGIRSAHGDRLEALINNAGLTIDKPLSYQPETDIDRMLQVNLKAPILLSKALAKLFLARGSGNIVNISSVVGQIGNAYQTVYSASKAGLIGFSKSLARECCELGKTDQIRVNVVCPGYVETDMTRQLNGDMQKRICQTVPMGRMGTAEEVARVVAFLLSSDASYVTGQVINVNGGMYS